MEMLYNTCINWKNREKMMITERDELIILFQHAHCVAYGHASDLNLYAMSLVQINSLFRALINTNF